MRLLSRLRGLTRRTWLVNATLGTLALAGGGWAYVLVADPGASAATGAAQRTGTVTTGAVASTVSASGTVGSANVANADFVTAGTVTEIDVKLGTAVTKGQVLAKVDPTAAKAALATATAQLTAAEQSLARARSSAATSSAATSATATSATAAVSAAQAQVTQAQATVDADQRAVDGTVLTAPIAGTVTAVNGAVGANSGGGASAASTGSSSGSSTSSASGSSSSGSSASSGFVQVCDLTSLQVSASFTESDATKIKVGQPATVAWTALSGATATGTVKSITPTATSTNSVNSYPVVITLTSTPDGVRLGQTVTAVVTVASVQDVIRVPKAAVKSTGGTHTVQVRDASGAVRTVTVEVGVSGDSYVEIRSGLTVGQQVLLTITTSGSTGTSGVQGGGGFPGSGSGGRAGP